MNFYFEAAKILDKLDAKQGSIKGVIATLPEKDRKRSAALIIETLKYRNVLSAVIAESKMMKEERKKLTSLNLVLLLVHDVLFSGGIQAGDGPIKQAVLRHKTRLRSELEKAKIKRGVRDVAELAQGGDERAAQIPRYVRVNTSLVSVDEVISVLKSRHFVESSPFDASGKGFQHDEHISNLLLLSPKLSFQNDELYTSGKIILQDKASCFPPAVLAPSPRSVVIDATAAPGNKTSHLSALMNNSGKLFAFERDKRRFDTLKTMLQRAGCKNVVPTNTDFLTVDPEDSVYAKATHILLDPSCSGSGIVNRLDYLLDSQDTEQDTEARVDEERLKKLASFQLLMIRHAMKFANVQKIVYSTCSIHAIENEHVVEAALASDEAKSGHFMVAPRDQVLPKWERRGKGDEMQNSELAASLVRCLPGEDATNGFFVSCFIRNTGTAKRKAEDGDEEEEEGDGHPAPAIKPKKKKKKKKKQ